MRPSPQVMKLGKLEHVAMLEAEDLEQSGVCNAKIKGMTRMMNRCSCLLFLEPGMSIA